MKILTTFSRKSHWFHRWNQLRASRARWFRETVEDDGILYNLSGSQGQLEMQTCYHGNCRICQDLKPLLSLDKTKAFINFPHLPYYSCDVELHQIAFSPLKRPHMTAELIHNNHCTEKRFQNFSPRSTGELLSANWLQHGGSLPLFSAIDISPKGTKDIIC